MNKQIRLIPALALGMAILSIPTLATAATTIDVVDQASIVGRGAGVLVLVDVTCDSTGPNSRLFADVSIIQRVGNSTTQGSGSISDTINCDGMPHRFEILVSPPSGKVFRQGSAIARASETVCDPSFFLCESAQATEEIRLIK